MWEQKKISDPQTFNSSQYPITPQQYQQMQQSMAGMGSAMGPPPPYSQYQAVPQPQQQPNYSYAPQMGYNPNPYLSNNSRPQTGGYPYAYPTAPPGPQYQYNPYQSLPPNTTVVMPQGFDAGARFDGIAKPNIPPPPPGVVPNAAQMAAMQGQSSVIGQKKGSFLSGGSSGGYTFW